MKTFSAMFGTHSHRPYLHSRQLWAGPLVCIILVMAAFAACDNSLLPDTHTHQWSELRRIIDQPTCVDQGYGVYVCALDSSHIGLHPIHINPDAHVWGEWVFEGDTAPVCTDVSATITRACNKPGCSRVEKMESKDLSFTHDWGDWIEKGLPTCTENGWEERTCSRDPLSHTEKRPKGDKLYHDYGNWIVTTIATATTAGLEERTCTRNSCNDKQTHEIPSLTDGFCVHSYGDWYETTKPTCTTPAWDTRFCRYDYEHEDTRPGRRALGHTWGENGGWEKISDPTCTEDGVEERTCIRDPSYSETRYEEAFGHKGEGWTTKTYPTCTTAGEEEGTCTNGGTQPHTVTRTVAIVDDAHNWNNNYVETTPATCTTAGVKTDTCSLNAAHTRTQEIAKNDDAHEWDGEWTDMEDGTEAQLCIRGTPKHVIATRDKGPAEPYTVDLGTQNKRWIFDTASATATPSINRYIGKTTTGTNNKVKLDLPGFDIKKYSQVTVHYKFFQSTGASSTNAQVNSTLSCYVDAYFFDTWTDEEWGGSTWSADPEASALPSGQNHNKDATITGAGPGVLQRLGGKVGVADNDPQTPRGETPPAYTKNGFTFTIDKTTFTKNPAGFQVNKHAGSSLGIIELESITFHNGDIDPANPGNGNGGSNGNGGGTTDPGPRVTADLGSQTLKLSPSPNAGFGVKLEFPEGFDVTTYDSFTVTLKFYDKTTGDLKLTTGNKYFEADFFKGWTSTSASTRPATGDRLQLLNPDKGVSDADSDGRSGNANNNNGFTKTIDKTKFTTNPDGLWIQRLADSSSSMGSIEVVEVRFTRN